MATNVSYASNDSVLESLVLHTLPDFGEHGDGIINGNFLFSYFKSMDAKEGNSKRFQEVEGGLEFWNGVLKAENSNFKWQSHTADMTAQLQDPNLRLRFPVKVFTGSIVINQLHEAQNKGKAMMKEWARTNREQAESTIPNLFNAAFWATSPGTDDPESIPSLISITPTTGTVGGVNRSTSAALQNYADTTGITDIGSEAGITRLTRARIRLTIGNGKDAPDLCIMDDANYAGLSGYLATLNRYMPNDRMAQLGFDSIKLGSMTIGYENTNVIIPSTNTITTGYAYLINSNYMKFKVLKDGNFIWDPKGFQRSGNSLNRALFFWVFCNLTTNLPRAHGVLTSISTA